MNEPIRVLCVDDNEDLADVVCMLVDRSPGLVSVGSLQSAQNLAEEADARDAHVILLDLTMPGPSPMDALRRLVAAHPARRVVVMSGHDDQETIDLAFSAGARGFVSKHGDPANIISAVRSTAAGESTTRVP